MTFDADMIVDRRRLRRKLTFWRAGAGIILILAICATAFYALDPRERARAHIARLPITGVILDDRARLQMIDKMAKSDAVKGVIIAIDSPGGSTSGGEGLLHALRKLAEKKPVVAYIGTVGASAGYMCAIAADHVVARRNAITGSIGVLFQFGNAKDLLETIGIDMDAVKSSPKKAEPNFYEPPSAEVRAMLEAMVQDSYDWFVDIVAERRQMDRGRALALADGSVFTGNQARERGLIDEIGGEEAATKWLVEKRGVGADLKVVTWTTDQDLAGLPLSGRIGAFFGETISAALFGQSGSAKYGLPGALALDGLVSVWQAPDVNGTNYTGGAGE